MVEQTASSSLENLGYKPQFKRVLKLRDLVIYGLVILTPTAPYPVYGIIQDASLGHAALAYLVAMVAMLFTAASYGKMSGAYPAAGSTYTYVQRALNEHIGFLAGWSAYRRRTQPGGWWHGVAVAALGAGQCPDVGGLGVPGQLVEPVQYR